MGRLSPATNRTIQFGIFELDIRAGELRKRGIKAKLQEQPLQILQILLESAGEVVLREDLRHRIWPADTFVDFDHGLNNAIRRLREALGDSADTPHFIETVARRGYRFIGHLTSTTPAPVIPSIAVLPLENLSCDPEQEYFADGLTEALITNLAKIGALRVISRTTVMQYKGVHRPMPQIARELGVGKVVEGTVLRSGNRVRISAQLIEAATDEHLWAESYERDMQDILALTSEVARAIAGEIQVKLTPQEHVQLATVHPVDPGAYEAYLKGRYYWNKRSADGVKKGAESFQQAVEKDPAYAAAYAGLADCAGSAGFWGFAAPPQGCGRAKAAAQKALEIDDTAEAHASLGWAILHYDFDHLAAEREFRRAISLDPRYATAHQWYGHCLGYIGRSDESVAETARALELDPLSLIIHASHAGAFWLARDWDRTIAHSCQALELDPNFAALHWILAHGYQGKGMYEQAILERKRSAELSGRTPVFVAELGGTYAAAGKKHEALQILQELHQLSKGRYVMAYWIALIHTGLREKDEAFHWLEKACDERSPMLAWAKEDPRLDGLRSDSRFRDLLHRMKFPA